MKAFVIQLLSVILVILIAGSIQSVTADHLQPGKGIFKDKEKVEVVTTQGSNYQVYLQTILRTGDGQLISVVEKAKLIYGVYPKNGVSHVVTYKDKRLPVISSS